MKKGLLLLLVLSILIAAVGCSGNNEKDVITEETTSENNQGGDISEESDTSGENITLPVESGSVELTWFKPMDENTASVINTWNENLTFQEIEKRTGIKLVFDSPPSAQATERFNLMIASDSLTDIVDSPQNYKGGLDKGIADGYFADLTEYKQYMPNYLKILESDEELMRQATTPSGKIGSINRIIATEPASWTGLFIREDWLQELGMEVPVTIEEWENVLYEFKNKEGCEIPLSCNSLDHYFWKYCGVFLSAYDIAYDFINRDGTVVYGPYDPAYKEVLILLNKWYKEGLIDPEFATRSSESIKANLSSSKVGALIGGSNLVQEAIEANGGDFPMVPVTAPKLTHDQEIKIRNAEWRVSGVSCGISASSENPEYAIALLDYFFSDEGYLLANFGIEGITYTIEDEVPSEYAQGWLKEGFKDKTIKQTDLIANNEELSYSQVQGKYLWYNPVTYHTWTEFLNTNEELSSYIYIKASDVWQQDSAEYVMPPVVESDDESEELAVLMGDIETYVSEMTLKFIMGAEPIENFDKYREQLKAMNIERAIEIKQNSLDAYLSK